MGFSELAYEWPALCQVVGVHESTSASSTWAPDVADVGGTGQLALSVLFGTRSKLVSCCAQRRPHRTRSQTAPRNVVFYIDFATFETRINVM